MWAVPYSCVWAIEAVPSAKDEKVPPVGTLKNIRISDVVAEVIVEDRAKAAEAVYKNLKVDNTPGVTDNEKSKAGPIMITGIPGHYIENVVLENIKISYPGHGTEEDAKRVVAEDEIAIPSSFSLVYYQLGVPTFAMPRILSSRMSN